MVPFRYRAYGLIFESQFECPELVAVSDGQPDVFVAEGHVPEQLENPTRAGFKFQARADQLLIKTNYIANILISQGNRITIQPKAGAHPDNVRALFLGWGIAALLHQRNTLPLHGSVVNVGDECVAFCAPSGTGKSSLAALFVNRGYALLDDNIVAIVPSDSGHGVYPGCPVIKLPDDVVRRPDYAFVTPGRYQSALRKFPMSVCQELPARPQPLKKIYILTRGRRPDFALKPLNGGAKFRSLMKNVFCSQFLHGMGKLSDQFRNIESLAANTPMAEVRLPDWPTPYEHVAQLLEQDFTR
ncbi:MAG: hypothetical protein HY782_21850 [Chloroflexi bacterium]|nr:hypothetical protein [Chloroflexota bacterium]